MPWRHYRELKIENNRDSAIKGKYSVTGDILSFQLCPMQYGFFASRGYLPAHVIQIWFGTVIHQVLDKLHMHYFGLLRPETKGMIPSDNDVERYFNEVEETLRARGIKAINDDLKQTALRVLKIFNSLEGPTLYPNIIDTECTLQNDQGEFILHGKVDVLKDISVGKGIKNYDLVEIWDYKGSKFPDINKKEGTKKLERYTYQMLTYANLYRLKKGNYPLKGVLYFLNELDSKQKPTVRPTQAVYEIDFRNPLNIKYIGKAMDSFASTVQEIKKCKLLDTWKPPKEKPDEETCDICDFRWDCMTVKSNYAMRYP